MKNAVVFGCWFPSVDRMDSYINLLVEYYSDCDIYIGINPSEHTNTFIEKLKSTNLTFFVEITPDHLVIKQHTSSTQSGIRLLIESGNKYNIVHFLHAKGISYNDYHYGRAFQQYLVDYGKHRIECEEFLNTNENYGAWSLYGGIQAQWFVKENNTVLTNRPYDNLTSTASSNINTESLKVHPHLDLGDYYNFDYLPLRSQFLTGIYSFKFFLIENFYTKGSKDLLNKHLIADLGYCIYFFETQIAQVSCRQGYLRYIKNYWNIGFGTQELESQIIEQYKKYNNL